MNARVNSQKDNISKRDELLVKGLQSLKESYSEREAEVGELKDRNNKMQGQITEREGVINKRKAQLKDCAPSIFTCKLSVLCSTNR